MRGSVKCWVSILILICLLVSIPTVGLAEGESVNGVYTHFFGYDYLYNCYSNTIKNSGSSDDDLFQRDRLVLFNNDEGYNKDRGEKDPYRGVWDTGNRYIYTRDFYAVNLGMHLSQTYLGHYTWQEGSSVTLDTPEIYSYQYMYGDATRWNDQYVMNVIVDYEAETTTYDEDTGLYKFAGEPDVKPNNWEVISGLYGFDCPYVEMHHSAGCDPLEIVLDLDSMTFEIPED